VPSLPLLRKNHVTGHIVTSKKCFAAKDDAPLTWTFFFCHEKTRSNLRKEHSTKAGIKLYRFAYTNRNIQQHQSLSVPNILIETLISTKAEMKNFAGLHTNRKGDSW
jgi:hypothetical protein